MIYSIMHSGSGLGNQLHRYIAMRCLALEKGYEFGVICSELFKGKSFIDLDMGNAIDFSTITQLGTGKITVETDMPLWEEKTNYYNPEFNFIEDNTVIDGEFQDPRYFEEHRLDIALWLQTKLIEIPDDTCVIGFRGGEYSLFPELFLNKEYWDEGIKMMKQKNPDMKFEVHTDDAELARTFFPDYPIIQNMEINWRSMRYAKHAIIANSSFYIFPRLLRGGYTIAPRYWARRNIHEWSMPANYYGTFHYI